MYPLSLLILIWVTLSRCPRCAGELVTGPVIVAEDLAVGDAYRCEVKVTSAVETFFLITVSKECAPYNHARNPAYASTLSVSANTSALDISFGEDALLCGSGTDATVENRGNINGETPNNYIDLMFMIYASDSQVDQGNGSDTCITFDAVAMATWFPSWEMENFTVDCYSPDSNISVTVISDGKLIIRMIVLIVYIVVTVVAFPVALTCCLLKCWRIRKMRHVYATFDSALASGRSSQVQQVQRTFSRRPTRSLPPIPSPKLKSHEIHYANAHLRLSQNSMPARLTHSMHSVISGLTVEQMNNRKSLPLHASNVSAQNALYFFTRPGDLSPKDIPVEKTTQGFTFPYNCDKSTAPKGLFKHHTMNHRSSTLFRKARTSDYQNWFQRFELSTSCPSIDAIEEGQEITDKVKSMVPLRNKIEKRKRRSLIRNRLSSAHKDRDQTLPRRKLPSLSRPLSEALLNPANPYVERGDVRSSCYSK